jgi:hypothetical protein
MVLPATVNLPHLELPVLLAAVTATVPLPVPDAPLETVRKLLLLTAVQLQADPSVVTMKTSDPSLAATAALVGVTA